MSLFSTSHLTQQFLHHLIVIVFLFVILICQSQYANGQDLIVKKTEGELVAKVTDIKNRHIVYLEYSDQDAKPQKISKSKVEMIIYEDGMKQYFVKTDPTEEIPLKPIQTDSKEIEDLYQRGQVDAQEHYDNMAAQWTTFGATLTFPLIGIGTGAATGGIISSTRINPKWHQVPDPELYGNSPEYTEGYDKAAKKKRLLRSATGFGLGLVVQAFAIILIFVSGL